MILYEGTQYILIALGFILLGIGFMCGRLYEYRVITQRLEELSMEVTPCCGNCKEYNGSYCTKDWNNLDEKYLDKDRDSMEPEDEPCDQYEFDEDWETY